MLLKALGNGHKRPYKNAGISAGLTAVRVFERFFVIRFLDELLGTMKNCLISLHTLRRRQSFAHFDITVAGSRFGRFDSDRNDSLATRGQIKRVRQHLLKFLLFRYDMV